MDYIFYIFLIFIVTITKVIGIGIAAYICWYLYKKYGEKEINKLKESK